MREPARRRAREAIQYMETGMGLHKAARRAHTAPGTVKKYARMEGIRLKTARMGIRKKVVRYTERIKKARQFLDTMQREDDMSATKAARLTHTTLGTMKDSNINDEPIIIKNEDTGRWEQNIYRIRNMSAVFFGRMNTYKSNIMGSTDTELTELGRTDEAPDIDLDERYAAILWQYDIDDMHTLYSPYDLLTIMPEKIYEFLKRKLEEPVPADSIPGHIRERMAELLENRIFRDVADTWLTSEFTTDDLVEMREEGVHPDDITMRRIEKIFGQLGVTISDTIECGIDDSEDAIEIEEVTKEKYNERMPFEDEGQFEIIIRRAGRNPAHYPPVPEEITYTHER